MRCQGDGFLVYCKTAVADSRLDIFFDVARIRGNDVHLLAVSIQRPAHLGHIDIDELLLLFHKLKNP